MDASCPGDLCDEGAEWLLVEACDVLGAHLGVELLRPVDEVELLGEPCLRLLLLGEAGAVLASRALLRRTT